MKCHHVADWPRPEASPEPGPRRPSGRSVEDAQCQEVVKAASVARPPKRLRSGLTSDCDAAGSAPRSTRPRRSLLANLARPKRVVRCTCRLFDHAVVSRP